MQTLSKLASVPASRSLGRTTEVAMLHFFDPADVSIIERRHLHWWQPGVVCFITFRTNDSMPRSVINRWRPTCMAHRHITGDGRRSSSS
ncbi:MAG: hypothetical protein R3B91_07610 [Planctomycetaceae bacterium]